MKHRVSKDWEKFKKDSLQMTIENTHKSRVTLKYRNKKPSSGLLYSTINDKSMRYKFTKKNDIDKIDPYLKLLLHMLANKPLSENIQNEQVNEKIESSKKKQKKGKKN